MTFLDASGGVWCIMKYRDDSWGVGRISPGGRTFSRVLLYSTKEDAEKALAEIGHLSSLRYCMDIDYLGPPG